VDKNQPIKRNKLTPLKSKKHTIKSKRPTTRRSNTMLLRRKLRKSNIRKKKRSQNLSNQLKMTVGLLLEERRSDFGLRTKTCDLFEHIYLSMSSFYAH
jgi:hypothetical protein